MKGLRIKYILWVCILFLAVGPVIYIPLSIYLPDKITSQILKRDMKIAEYISHEIKDPLLTRDELALNLLLHDNLENLQDAEYIFIQDGKGKIVAHTFAQGFPVDLLNINQGKSSGVKKFLAGGKEYFDLAVPIFAGSRDRLHLGVALKSGKKEIAEFARINYYVAGAIFIGLSLGFAILLVLGTQEVKRIISLEERNRLAVELHDGMAQSLANVVMRLELCQKLFENNSIQATDELNKLKENARELVKDARRAIANLKEA